MADWDYIVGETGYNQPFVIYDKRTKLPVDGTGITSATITIVKSDLSAVSPAITDAAMSVDTVNPLRLLYSVSSATPNVPQTEGSYLAIISMNYPSSKKRKTFELDLRVYRG
jgi:hypothetical protein